MTKYLIRRRNRWGQWAHIETLDYPPSREEVERTFGPGEYSIMAAEEGVRGLRSYASYSIPYSIEYVDWTPDKPDIELISERYGQGNYFVMGRATDIQPMTIAAEKDGMVEDLMMQGVNVMRKVYVIFRLKGLPYQ